MIRTTRAGLGATLMLPIALVIAACGGGATPSTAASAAASIAASVAPDVSVDPNVSLDPAAIPSFDLGALTGALPGVDSYRTTFAQDGVVTYESVVVTKPEVAKAITTFEDDGTTVDSRIILIGKKAWQAEGADGDFEEIPEAIASSMLMLFDPALLLGAYTNMDWTTGIGADKGTESKNGVDAHHLRIDATTFPTLAASMPAGAGIDIWVADAGYLVSWEMSGFGGDQNIAIQVTNVNDPANKVEAP